MIPSSILPLLVVREGKQGVGGGGILSSQTTMVRFTSHKTKFTFLHLLKIEVVQSIKNATLVPFCKTECMDYVVWFQKISRPPPQRELEIPGGWGDQRPRKFQKGGGLDHKITFQRVFPFRPEFERCFLPTW